MLLCEAWRAKTILTRGLQAQWLRLFSQKKRALQETRLLSNTAWHKPTSATSTEFYFIPLHTSTSLLILAIYCQWWNGWTSVFFFFFARILQDEEQSLQEREVMGKSRQEKRASLTARFRLEEWMPSPLRHEHVSYLLICWRQKGFLLFRNWTLVARWVSHTKLPCCQRYFFPLGFLLLLFGFLPQRVKGRTVDSAGAKGGIRDSTGELQSSL